MLFHWLTYIGTIKDIKLEFIGLCSSSHRLDIVAVAALNAYWLNALISPIWNFVEIQTYYTFSLMRYNFGSCLLSFTFLCITNLMKSPLDQMLLICTLGMCLPLNCLPLWLISNAKSWESMVRFLFNFVW